MAVYNEKMHAGDSGAAGGAPTSPPCPPPHQGEDDDYRDPGSIKKKTCSEIKFTDKDPLSVFVRASTSFTEFKDNIIRKLDLQGMKRVEKLFYRISISVLRDDVKYDSFVISSDEDLEVLFHCRRQFPEVRTPELLAKLVDVVSSSRGSNRIPLTSATAVGLCSRPIGASSSLPVIEPDACLVASLSFAVDLDRTRDTERVDTVPVVDATFAVASIVDVVPDPQQGGALDGVEDVFQDEDNDDVELAMIADDSDDEDEKNTPNEGGVAGSSGTLQYPSHFSALDLDAMRQQGDPTVPAQFGARDI
ncbi:uncharacterized protein LOC110265138 [Arachis ipaensis]|uniref:uncharacterized protein LOC110265138 n=1 Tax=Arachis ipaensis TaxID=130454 RepID=UPI000A2B0756|nr:uncharacterized protein LOC110265138 [Arachis ipaensis]